MQAAAASEASEAAARLELLRGSIVWEEWREARDAHRRATSQVQGLERRLVEARELAHAAEAEFQSWRTEIQAAQDRRLARQRNLGRLRLEVAEAEHEQRLTEERAHNTVALADSARREEAENQSLSGRGRSAPRPGERRAGAGARGAGKRARGAGPARGAGRRRGPARAARRGAGSPSGGGRHLERRRPAGAPRVPRGAGRPARFDGRGGEAASERRGAFRAGQAGLRRSRIRGGGGGAPAL